MLSKQTRTTPTDGLLNKHTNGPKGLDWSLPLHHQKQVENEQRQKKIVKRRYTARNQQKDT